MDKDNLSAYIKYSPIIIVILAFCFSYKIFVTPSDLESRLKTHDAQIAATYATKQQVESQEKQLDNISKKIDKIYDYIIGRK